MMDDELKAKAFSSSSIYLGRRLEPVGEIKGNAGIIK